MGHIKFFMDEKSKQEQPSKDLKNNERKSAINKEIKKKKAMLPSGIDNFYNLVTHRNPEGNPYLFVDKSLFIKEFISAGDSISLITRPRRFGKTLTLSMLQHFLAPEVNEKSTKGLFDGLKISKHPEIMAYQGQYPVIFLTLKEIRGRNFEEAFARFKPQIRCLFEVHNYLLKSQKVTNTQKNYTKNY